MTDLRSGGKKCAYLNKFPKLCRMSYESMSPNLATPCTHSKNKCKLDKKAQMSCRGLVLRCNEELFQTRLPTEVALVAKHSNEETAEEKDEDEEAEESLLERQSAARRDTGNNLRGVSLMQWLRRMSRTLASYQDDVGDKWSMEL